MKTARTALFIVVGTIAMARAAIAETHPAHLTVTASVQNTCVITGGTLAFGAYDTVNGAAVDASTALSVQCSQGTDTPITLNEGDNADAGSAANDPLRRLTDGATGYLSYALVSDAGLTSVWVDPAATGKDYSPVSAAAVDQTVYGRLAANQDEKVGSYSDPVIATIIF